MEKYHQYEDKKNKEVIKSWGKRRISKLYYMFDDFGIKNIDITGNPEFPSVIINNNELLHTYINNFNIAFLDDLPKKGYIPNTIISYKIAYNEKLGNEFKKYLKEHETTRIYTIRHLDTGLYLSGYNLKTEKYGNTEQILYPVFSRYKRKYFFEKEYANNVIIKNQDYPLIID